MSLSCDEVIVALWTLAVAGLFETDGSLPNWAGFARGTSWFVDPMRFLAIWRRVGASLSIARA
jgi:hypothetical protein